MKVMVLAGGPDRERTVSLQSGIEVVEALRQGGHDVELRDVMPGDLSALGEWARWPGDVIFPVLHGPWGEGGPLQRELEARRIPFVGCTAHAADLCMDKYRTKIELTRHGLPTPPSQLITGTTPLTFNPPLVIKPPREGSSIDLCICHDTDHARATHRKLMLEHTSLLVERYIVGKEVTVGIIGGPSGDQALPPIRIIPSTGFYDYEAKYTRDDTRYILDPLEIGIPAATLDAVRDLALQAHEVLGCRHMSRVDFMIDQQDQPWILEVNTIPGFTSHSLLPKAAAHAGLPMPNLVDRLVRLACGN